MREIALTNGETVTVYDTSGPYTDPDETIDVRKGLEALRRPWIEGRGDVEEYVGREPKAIDNGFETDNEDIRPFPIFVNHCVPRWPECHAASLRATGHHHPGNGIHRHPRK